MLNGGKLNNFKIAKFLIVVLFLGFLLGCSKKDPYKGLSEEEIYQMSQKSVAKKNFAQASKDFEALESRYPYGKYSDKAQLGLIEAYYKQNEPNLALASANRFIRMHPRHPQVDYAYYMKGVVTYDEHMTFMYRYFPVDRSLRDPSSAQESFDAFKELLERFPNSQYAQDARQRSVHLRDHLARYEMQVVEYYMKRGAYLSAANRASYIVKHFHQTSVIPQALSTMAKAYHELGMEQLAADAERILKANYPNYK